VYVNDKILTKLEDFQEKDSGWALYEILYLKVNINKYNPIKVGFSTYCDLPTFIQNTKSVINIKNNDEYCFLWSVVCALYPAVKNKNVFVLIALKATLPTSNARSETSASRSTRM
jgi:hypothetical protein